VQEELYSIPEAARKLRVGRTTIYGLLDSGELDSIRIGQRRLVTDSQLDAYVAKRKRPISSPTVSK
jgi:excisionase family DNA binding protein